MLPSALPTAVLDLAGGAAVSRWVWRRLPIPAQSRFRMWWDFVMATVMAYIVLTVPVRIGFRVNDWVSWMAPDLLTDILLVLDMFICSVTCYEVEGEEVRDLDAIRARYLRTAFPLDLAAVFPLELFVAFFVSYEPWLRCNRLLRLFNMAYYFRMWEMESFLKPSLIRLINSCVVVVMLGHFFACAFFLVIVIEDGAATETFTGHPDILSLPFPSQYLRAYHWAFVTMIGFNNTNPQRYIETIFSIVVNIIGISIVAISIGNTRFFVQHLDSSALLFRQKIDTMNDFMKYKQVPGDLQEEVRNYYTYLWRSGKGLEQNKLLADLPLSLKNRLNIALNSGNIKKVPLFERVKDDDAFIAEVVKCLKPQVFLPNAFVVRKGEVGTQMFFIHRGELAVVSDDGQAMLTLRDGGFFGEIALLYDTKRTATIVARTYCDLFVLDKEDLKKVMRKFPDLSEVIHEAAHRRFQHIVENQRKRDASEDGSSESSMTSATHPVFSVSQPRGRLRRCSTASRNRGLTQSVSSQQGPPHRLGSSFITDASSSSHPEGASFATTGSHGQANPDRAATRQLARLDPRPKVSFHLEDGPPPTD